MGFISGRRDDREVTLYYENTKSRKMKRITNPPSWRQVDQTPTHFDTANIQKTCKILPLTIELTTAALAAITLAST